MAFVVALCGAESEKFTNGQRMLVVPFVGADREGELAQMGIGIMSRDGQMGSIWGLVMPHPIVQCWRAMKILERIEVISGGTLCACWTLARRHLHDGDERHLNELALQLGGEEQVRTVREGVLASAPDARELDAMLTALREKGVGVDARELLEETSTGSVAMTPLIETIFCEAEAARREYERREEEIRKSLPAEESLGVFFRDLGLGNFTVGSGVGMYDLDWGHIALDELDEVVKRDSFSKYLPDGHRLERTTQGPEISSISLGSDITVFVTRFGSFEQPWFVATDGARYTFISAKFRDGGFFINTKIEREGVLVADGEYGIGELREMIGVLPRRSQCRLLNWILSFFR